MRKSWMQHFMEHAEHVCEMSTCASGRKVGAVFVKDKRVLSTGVNGVPSGYPHPLVCLRKELKVPSGQGLEICGCMHAEANGIANAARTGVSLLDSSLYCTTEPCVLCMGLLANIGIKEVVFKEKYHHELSKDIAEKANIVMTQYVEINGVGMLQLEDGI